MDKTSEKEQAYIAPEVKVVSFRQRQVLCSSEFTNEKNTSESDEEDLNFS